MRIKVFLALQFGNAKVSRSDKEISLIKAISKCNRELKEEGINLELFWNGFNLKSGKPIANQLLNQIEKSGIFIADLSELNKNVLFELGIAYSFEKLMNKEIIWLIHDSLNTNDLPSDIKGLYCLEYSKETLEYHLTSALKERVKHLLNKKYFSSDILESFWNFQLLNQIDILCSEIPNNLLPYYADLKDRNYLRYAKFADLDTLIYLKSNIPKICSKINIRDFSPNEYFDTNTKQLFIIGGPPWNSKYKEFQKLLPFYFEANDLGKDDPLCFSDYDIKLFPSWTSKGELINDISVYSRLIINDSFIIHLFGGCLTFGVLGAAKVFFDLTVSVDNINWIEEHINFNKNFSIVFPTNVINSTSIPTNISKASFKYIFQQNEKNIMELIQTS